MCYICLEQIKFLFTSIASHLRGNQCVGVHGYPHKIDAILVVVMVVDIKLQSIVKANHIFKNICMHSERFMWNVLLFFSRHRRFKFYLHIWLLCFAQTFNFFFFIFLTYFFFSFPLKTTQLHIARNSKMYLETVGYLLSSFRFLCRGVVTLACLYLISRPSFCHRFKFHSCCCVSVSVYVCVCVCVCMENGEFDKRKFHVSSMVYLEKQHI